MKNVLFKVLGVSLVVASFAAFAGLNDTGSLEDRVKPVGETCMKGDDCAQSAAAAGGGEKSVDSIYTTKCAACHTTGAAGAPKIAVAEEWTARLGKGMDVLYENAIKGYNAMPAMGLCFDCTEDDIRRTVDYMIEKSK